MRAKEIANKRFLVKYDNVAHNLDLHLIVDADLYDTRTHKMSGTVIDSNNQDNPRHAIGHYTTDWNFYVFKPLEDLCEPKK